jgi:hypothetical protein
MLTKYGDLQISDMSIFRAPVEGSSLLVKVINGLSSQNIPYEKLFHLGLLISVGSTKIRIEKNEVIAIDDMFSLKPGTETIAVSLNKQLTLNELLNNTVNKIGNEKMFKYSAFKFNCQCFVRDVLESNGMYNDGINNFVYQPMTEVVKNMNKYVVPVANAITNTASYINKMIGGNKLNDKELKLLQQVLHLLNK